MLSPYRLAAWPWGNHQFDPDSTFTTVRVAVDRAALLGNLNRLRGDRQSSHPVRECYAHQHQALQLIAGQKGSNNPFDLSQEPEKIRQQSVYEEWGQALLVESGVRMVQVNLLAGTLTRMRFGI